MVYRRRSSCPDRPATPACPALLNRATVDGTFFPIAPALTLSVPSYHGSPAFSYTFGGLNRLDTSVLKTLRDNFDKLAVQVHQELNPSQNRFRAASAVGAVADAASRTSGLVMRPSVRRVQGAPDLTVTFSIVEDVVEEDGPFKGALRVTLSVSASGGIAVGFDTMKVLVDPLNYEPVAYSRPCRLTRPASTTSTASGAPPRRTSSPPRAATARRAVRRSAAGRCS